MADEKEEIVEALLAQRVPSWRQGKRGTRRVFGPEAFGLALEVNNPALMRQRIQQSPNALVDSTPQLEQDLAMMNRWSPAMKSWFAERFSPLFGYPVEPSGPR